MSRGFAVFLLLAVGVCLSAAKSPRPSSIRSDLKALIRYTKLEISVFVETCTTSRDYEDVLSILFPAVEVVVVRANPDVKVRTSGRVITAALAEKTGDITVLVNEENDAGEVYEKKVERVVSVTSMDDVMKDNGFENSCPEFIRITQNGGYELNILKGALHTLSCTKVVCVTANVMRANEKMPFAADIIGFMNEHGFAIYNTYENHRIRFFNIQIDILFVKKEIMDEMYEVGFKDHVQ